MAQYHVPQFIEVESKIFGPLTFKQFIYLIGAAAAIVLLYVILPFWLMFLAAIPIGGLGLGLAFYKVQGRPLEKMIASALGYITSPKLYIWKKAPARARPKIPTKKGRERPTYVPKLTESKLKELAWSLDIKEKLKR
jgi:hypothetical protein